MKPEDPRPWVVPLIDLTTLSATDDEASVERLVRRAVGGDGQPAVAAVCVPLDLVESAVGLATGSAVRVATVAGGFPHGRLPLEHAVAEVRYAVEHGADEVDVVIDRAAVIGGRASEAEARLRALRGAAAGVVLKVILETGELAGIEGAVEAACAAALAAGADFLKTSTGKIPTGATPAAVEQLARAAAACSRPVGVKVSGGVRSWEDAVQYADIVASHLGSAAARDPARLRFGASGLLDAPWPV